MLLYEIASRSAILLILDVVFDADSRGSNRLANLELFSAYLVCLAHGELSYLRDLPLSTEITGDTPRVKFQAKPS